MSRFESSKFARNPFVINADILISACESLGWSYSLSNNILTVSDIGQDVNLYGEYALKLNLSNNEVTYNTYYLPNAQEKILELQHQFYKFNAAYSRSSLIQEFKKRGFKYKSNEHFVPTADIAYSFYMVAHSKDKNEDEPYAEIKFQILNDGTIITDSDYLPNDVNEKAHDAMDRLETLLGNKRVMTKKPVPPKYLNKMKPRRTTIQQTKQK